MSRRLSDYSQAILWFLLSLVVSCSNDALTKYLGESLSPWQVAFFRCLWGTLSLLPLLAYQGPSAFKTQRPALHLLRGVLLFGAMSLWTHGVQTTPITTATIMSFTVPIFVLLLAPVFLQEKVTVFLWLATLFSFSGMLLVLYPGHWAWQPSSFLFVVAAFLFALLDVVNKKYVTQEPILSMLFYSNLVASALLLWPAVATPGVPTGYDLFLLGLLGIGGNLILYFLLKAFALASASSLAPFRYLELLISLAVGYLVFQELPTGLSYLGAAIIIPNSLLIVYAQSKHSS